MLNGVNKLDLSLFLSRLRESVCVCVCVCVCDLCVLLNYSEIIQLGAETLKGLKNLVTFLLSQLR